MKINKLFFGLLGAAMLFTACSENDDDDYKWASVSGDQVYFSSQLGTSIDLEDNGSSFTIPLKRINTASSATVQLETVIDSTANANGIFTVPTSVSFDSGSDVANIVISYDRSKLEYDDYYPFTLKIAESDMANATPYGLTSYSFQAGVPAPLKLLGRGTFADNFWFEETSEVLIFQNTLNANEFRIMDPFGPMYSNLDENKSPYATIRVLQPGDVVGDVTITQSGLVYFDDMCTGYYNSSYSADVYLLHPSRFTSLRDESNYLKSKVIGWQENGLPGQIQLAPYYYMFGVGGWNNISEDGVVVITFPGYVPLDLSASLMYLGIFTNPSQEVFAMGSVELGEDVKDARAVIVSQDADAEAVAAAIAAGELEATQVESGTIYVPMPEDLSGKLQLVIVVINEGEVKTIRTAGFEYYGGGVSPWQSLGIGLYTEDFISSVFGADPITYEVEIEENTNQPGLYRMLNPYGEAFPYNEEGDWDATTDYNIEVNAEDPEGVYIDLQPTGVDWGYGAISIISQGARYLGAHAFEDVKAAGYLGTLVDGVITLPAFERQTDNGVAYYQGITYMGSSGYYGCTNAAFKLVLPEAVTAQARKVAADQANCRAVLCQRRQPRLRLGRVRGRIVCMKPSPFRTSERLDINPAAPPFPRAGAAGCCFLPQMPRMALPFQKV